MSHTIRPIFRIQQFDLSEQKLVSAGAIDLPVVTMRTQKPVGRDLGPGGANPAAHQDRKGLDFEDRVIAEGASRDDWKRQAYEAGFHAGERGDPQCDAADTRGISFCREKARTCRSTDWQIASSSIG